MTNRDEPEDSEECEEKEEDSPNYELTGNWVEQCYGER